MLRDWSDEWKNARLALELRGDQLFQGETLSVVVKATLVLDTTPSGGGAPLDVAGAPESEASLSAEEARTLALEKLEARWRRHCDGALVDLKVIEPTPSKADKTALQHATASVVSASQPHQPRATLFHQESRLTLLPLRPDDATLTTKSAALRVTLAMRCECTLRVRAEFWQRPLALVARVTPNSFQEESDVVVASSVQPLTSMVLNEAFTRTHIFGLLREQTTEPPNLTRRVEHKLRVAKPLLLKMETKFMGGARVAIIARATNSHDAMGVRVLDLQLHINQFAGSGSSTSGASRTGEFHIAKAPTDAFPVELQPFEQYNFVFIVEPTSTVGTNPSPPDANAPVVSSLSSHQSLLTMSWETVTSTYPPEPTTPLLQPITEHHTILWSPYPHRALTTTPVSELLEVLPRPPPLVPSVPLENGSSANPETAISVVRRGDRSCPLGVKLAPLQTAASLENACYRVGVVETLCVVVVNRSQDSTEYDLTLVIPLPEPAHRSWLAFETSHHLGRLRPGMIIRKSVRFVFLRQGCANLNALLLFDHISRTWFVPPSPSPSSAWDVFVHS